MEPLGGPLKNKKVTALPVGQPPVIPAEPRRTRTRDYMPSSIKPGATNIIDFSPERDHAQVLQSSITIAPDEAMHNQVLLTNNSGSTVFPLMQRGTFVNALTTDNLLPQFASGAEVGSAETSFQVIGPYNALYAKTETDPIENSAFADQLYVRNITAGETFTLICQVRVRFFLDQGGTST